MENETRPLVSICTTFLNAERYINRFLESCIQQTYRDIEIIIVDNASTDGSEKVVREYVARDSRVKYFKNTTRLGLTESLMKTFKLARGRFVIFPGADDWLARDFIEQGVRSFAEHPDAAGIVPRMVGLREAAQDRFTYEGECNLPSKVYSREWYLRTTYKALLTPTALALIRREDALRLMDYFRENYCRNPALPEDTRELYHKGFTLDAVFFLEILRRYASFVWNGALTYLKVTHSANVTYTSLKWSSLPAILKSYYYHLLTYGLIYEREYPPYRRQMKIYLGAEMLATALVYLARSGFQPSFLNVTESKKQLSDFFSGFSGIEVAFVVVRAVLRILHRFLTFMARRVVRAVRPVHELPPEIFRRENFLDPNGRFSA